MRSNEPEAIYALAARHYRQAGWRGVLPLPPKAKYPPPAGFTGYDGAWPTDDDYRRWIASYPADANTGLRLNYGQVGIDVNAHWDKTGERTLKEAERRWGLLPPTYRSSARPDDPVSGIRVFRVPVGSFFCSQIKFDELGLRNVDIIQPHHRLIVAWPSIHPKTGGCYLWNDDRLGVQLPEERVPFVDDLPGLPTTWIEGAVPRRGA